MDMIKIPKKTIQIDSTKGEVDLSAYSGRNVLIKPINDNVTFTTLEDNSVAHFNVDDTLYEEQEYWGYFNKIEIATGELLIIIFD